jgi:hypothetical protein
MCAVAISGFMFSACQGEDGEPGATGPQGEKGDKGDTGEQGVGFDESTTLGNIVVRYKGTRADNVPFDETIDFKFAPTGPNAVEYSYASRFSVNDGFTGYEFGVARVDAPMVTPDSEGSNNNLAGFRITKYDGTEMESTVQLYSTVIFASDDMKYFTLNVGENNTSISDAITDFSFSSVTGELKFKFEWLLPANMGNNQTGHPIEFTADVDVKVFQDIEEDSE